MTPADLVQRQLDAYNAHDLDAFVACFAADVRIHRMPDLQPALTGRDALRAYYDEHRFRIPGLRAELRGRITLGTLVIDHEWVHGLGETPMEVAAIYRVTGETISDVHFFYP